MAALSFTTKYNRHSGSYKKVMASSVFILKKEKSVCLIVEPVCKHRDVIFCRNFFLILESRLIVNILASGRLN